MTNPQLDHYFSKSTFPILQLSFYNLIPSCETCNVRIKGQSELEYGVHVHPYESGFGPEGRFSVTPKNYDSFYGVEEEYKIGVEFSNGVSASKKEQVLKSFDFFHIAEIYEHHGAIISEVYSKTHRYDLAYLKSLEQFECFRGSSIEDIYRMVFGNYLNISDFSKRPFAKLVHDTFSQLRLD